MTKLLALLLLALPACGADLTLEFEGSTAPLAATEGPPELLGALAVAASEWRDAGVAVPYIDAAAWRAQGELDDTCGLPEGVHALGCAGGARMWILDGALNDPRLPMVIRHEMGHLIRDSHTANHSQHHLPCEAMPGDDLMCSGGSYTGDITDRDIAWVQGAPL
jgi:hypothetical protein